MKNTFTLGLLFVFVGSLSAADGLEVEPLPPTESMAAAHVAGERAGAAATVREAEPGADAAAEGADENHRMAREEAPSNRASFSSTPKRRRLTRFHRCCGTRTRASSSSAA